MEGQLTHKVVTGQLYIGCRAGKVCRPKTDILIAELRRHTLLWYYHLWLPQYGRHKTNSLSGQTVRFTRQSAQDNTANRQTDRGAMKHGSAQ